MRGGARNNALGNLRLDCKTLRLELGIGCWDVALGGSWGHCPLHARNLTRILLVDLFCKVFAHSEHVRCLRGSAVRMVTGDGCLDPFMHG
jgi:hypothetical protein